MKLLLPLCWLLFASLAIAQEHGWDKAELQLPDTPTIKVYRDPDCQCCHRWIKHLQTHNFNVIDLVTPDMTSIKQKAGIPRGLASCHTAIVDGYLIEGHVPADDIKRLLLSKSDNIKGLSVPQMPVGTPGMELDTRQDDFVVLQFDKNDHIAVFNGYQADSAHHYHAHPPQE